MVDADIEALEHAGSPWIDTVRLDSWGTPAVEGALAG
jgi:GDPmannose 4,6-dehydratase